MNAQISKLVCIVNRLNVAPRSMKPDVEKELLDAAKELVESQSAQPPSPTQCVQIESAIARHRAELKTERDPLKVSAIVAKIRGLRKQLPS